MSPIRQIIEDIPLGYSEVLYEGSRYSVTKDIFNDGNSIKVFARSLSGTDFISFNYYLTNRADLLKPCEMPEAKVVDFLKRMEKPEESDSIEKEKPGTS